MNRENLWAWWWAKQGLDGSLQGKSPREALVRAGWSRSVGGASPYIAVFARTERSMADTDQAVADLEIHELPSARGCTHVLPRDDFALGLKVSQGFGDDVSITQAVKYLGVTEEELGTLGGEILKALEKGPLDPKQLKAAVGDAARHLGAEGKKKGTTTTLSLGLGKLQTHGKIRRVPQTGRLDRQRYNYALWEPSPLEGFKLTREEAFTELARHYFSWIGPASMGHFRWFSELGVQAAKLAVAPLNLLPVEPDSDLLILPEELDAFKAYARAKEPVYSLIASLDSHLNLRRDIVSLLAAENLDLCVPTSDKVVPINTLQDLYSNAILDRGRIVGLWEFDPEANEIVWVSFVGKPSDLLKAVALTESYVRDQLGDCRSFSLDSPESRKPKLAVLREMAAARRT